MSAALIALAVEIGAPLIVKILGRKIGAENAELAGDVIGQIARRAGTTPDRLEDMVASDPDTVREAIAETERMAPEMVALYASGLEYQTAVLRSEETGPAWARVWRPAGMYLIGFLWLWNVVLLHVANAIWKIALPAMDLWILFQLSGLYMGLYMGGHTLKDFFSHKWGAR